VKSEISLDTGDKIMIKTGPELDLEWNFPFLQEPDCR